MTHTAQTYTLRATLVSLFCNVVLVVIKTSALLVVNSLAIAVDLGISIVGLAVSVILYYSIRLANRPADNLHNYGYGKVEHVCEAMEGVVLIGIALAMSSQSFTRLLHPKHVNMPLLGCLASAINAFINFGGGYYIFRMARKSQSPAIHAEGVHYVLEGFISGVVGLSFIVSIFLIAEGADRAAMYVDPLSAIAVSLLVVVPSIKLARKAFFNLLDASVEEESQLEIIRHIGARLSDFCEFKDLKTRTAGRDKFIEFTLVIPESMPLREGHDIVSRLEDRIKKGIPDSTVNIRLEPCKCDCSYVRDRQACPYMS